MTGLPRIYVDMDDVLADYDGEYWHRYRDNMQFPQAEQGFYENLEPIPMATESFHYLSDRYDVWIATAPSVRNPLCYTEKRLWVEKYLGIDAVDKLIIVPNKSLLVGDILIDDNVTGRGQENFMGDLVHFNTVNLGKLGVTPFPNWGVAVNKVEELLAKRLIS